MTPTTSSTATAGAVLDRPSYNERTPLLLPQPPAAVSASADQFRTTTTDGRSASDSLLGSAAQEPQHHHHHQQTATSAPPPPTPPPPHQSHAQPVVQQHFALTRHAVRSHQSHHNHNYFGPTPSAAAAAVAVAAAASAASSAVGTVGAPFFGDDCARGPDVSSRGAVGTTLGAPPPPPPHHRLHQQQQQTGRAPPPPLSIGDRQASIIVVASSLCSPSTSHPAQLPSPFASHPPSSSLSSSSSSSALWSSDPTSPLIAVVGAGTIGGKKAAAGAGVGGQQGVGEMARALPRRFWVQSALVNGLLLYFFASHIVVAFWTKPLVFVLHPILASLWLILAVNATLLQQHCHKTPLAAAGRRVHSALQVAAVSCLILTIAVVYYFRHATQKPHFESRHSQLGLATLLSALGIAVLGGAAQWSPVRCFGSVLKSRVRGLRPHRFLGVAVLALSLLTVSGVTLFKWEAKAFSTETRFALGAALAGVFAVVAFGFRP
ncbi:hypothetical protein DFJ73DRAFT_84136 [Zopfochytrium polystomum]|nr:hypothetical protein DFJ73DRAFT_84136 [Zopfochytrium polystomum]